MLRSEDPKQGGECFFWLEKKKKVCVGVFEGYDASDLGAEIGCYSLFLCIIGRLWVLFIRFSPSMLRSYYGACINVGLF